MMYVLLALSLTANGLLVWYIRKLLQKYWFDVDVRQKFTNMLEQYSESLNSFYKLEELYGEEIIKKAILQTQFVIEACKEFRESIDTESNNNQPTEEDGEVVEAEVVGGEVGQAERIQDIIRLREGEKVSQSASNYRRVVADR